MCNIMPDIKCKKKISKLVAIWQIYAHSKQVTLFPHKPKEIFIRKVVRNDAILLNKNVYE